jgi:hypothetical protein
MQVNPLLIVLLVAVVWFGAAGIAIGVSVALSDEDSVDEEEIATLVQQAVDDYVPTAVEGYVPAAGETAGEKEVIARMLLIMAAQRLVLPDAFREAYFPGASDDDYDRCLAFLSGGRMSAEEGTEGFAACDRVITVADLSD